MLRRPRNVNLHSHEEVATALGGTSKQTATIMNNQRHAARLARSSRAEPPLTMDERHEAIVDFLKKETKISVEELSDRLRVSQVTIRKDLDSLEKRGLIERSHGNAIFSQQSRFNIAFLEKLQMQAREKDLIARAAASYVHEGDSIILDSGTTTLSLAKALVGRFKSLFVI